MTFPEHMLAIEISQNGAPDVLKASQRDTPQPSSQHVLIKVAAAGVNRPDVMQRKGLYPPPPGASDIPGLEIAGTVVALGPDVRHLQVGDSVCALVSGGGYADYCLATESLCLPIPAGFSFVQSAALPETFFTVWSNVFDRARLLPGETLLVHGGGSGIGTTAIQLAKAFGANVIVTAGTDAKCQRCLELGADAAINYQQQGFVKEVNELTHNKGVDVILDMIGGDYLPRNIQCMAYDARLVQIAVQRGTNVEINLLPLLLRRLTLTGSTLRARDDAFKADIADKLLNNVWPLLASGQIKPVIHTVYPLEEAAKAHALMESGRHFGKIVLARDFGKPGATTVKTDTTAILSATSADPVPAGHDGYYTTLISAPALHKQLHHPDWVVIDCRFSLANSNAGAKAYRLGHLPNARYAHLDKDLSSAITTHTGRHPLPDVRLLAEKLGRWGINKNSQVIVYDDANGAFAGRLWWLLRYLGHSNVAVLDGGLKHWQKRGLPLTTTLPNVKPTTFTPSPDNTAWLNATQLQNGLAQKTVCLMDARSPERFRGEQEPIDPIAGHIPSAINRPFPLNLDQDGLFLTAENLREQFKHLLGTIAPEQTIHMCGSGVTACHNLLAMEHAGLTGSKLYAGSWSEWIRNKNRGVATV